MTALATVPTPTVTAVETNTEDLAGAIKAVLPHVSKDKLLPVMAAVQFQLADGHLYLTATDRYSMGRSKVATTLEPGETFYTAEALIDAADVKRIAGFLKTTAKTWPFVTVIFGSRGNVTIEAGHVGSMTVSTVDGQFPKVAHLLDKDKAVGEVGGLNVNGDYMARFATKNLARNRTDGHMAVQLDFTRNGGPIRVEFSDHFVGLLMTMRRPDPEVV